MKSLLKRTLVFLMAFVMILGCVPVQVFAAETMVISDKFDANLSNLAIRPKICLKEYNRDTGIATVIDEAEVQIDGSFSFNIDDFNSKSLYAIYISETDSNRFQIIFDEEYEVHPEDYDGITSSNNDNEYVIRVDKTNNSLGFDKMTIPKIQPIFGSLEITKIELDSEDVPVMDAEFAIYLLSKDAGPILVGTKKTDANGKILFENLLCGEYRCEEISTPDGYHTSDFTASFPIVEGTNPPLKVTNEPKCSVTIKKIDAETNNAIEGVTFGLYKEDNTLIQTKITDNDGVITFDGLHYGKYYVQETSVGNNKYELNDTKYDVELAQTNQHPSYLHNTLYLIPNTPLYDIYVTKFDTETNNGLAGAELVLKDENGQIVHQWISTGSADVIPNLKSGKYTIEEVKEPDGYFKSNEIIDVTVSANGKFNYTLGNTPIYKITIQKVDDEGIGVADAELVLKNSNGDKVFTWKTTGNPDAMPNLAPGIYTISETVTPSGYHTSEDQTITVGKNAETKIQFINKIIRYSITINKFDTETNKPLAGAKLELRDLDGNLIEGWTSLAELKTVSNLRQGQYILVETEAPSGYRIDTSTTNITIAEGGVFHYDIGNTPLYNITVQKVDDEGAGVAGAGLALKEINGDVIYEWISTGNPDAMPQLTPGQYVITETSTPNGYHTHEDMTIFVGEGQNTNIKFTNEIIRYSIAVSKFDTETGNLLAGAQLELKDANGNVIHSWISTTATETIPNLKPGIYTIKEVSAPNGYENSNTELTVTVVAGGVFNYNIGNTPLYDVTIQKVDDEGQGLAGAGFELRDADNNLVYTWTSTGNPDAMPKLKPGVYTIKETHTPDGYIGIGEQTFIVSKTSNKNLIFTNTLIRYDINVRKYDSETNANLAGAKMVLKDIDGAVVYEWTTTDGVENIPNLKPGVYTISEVSAPSGYRFNGSVLTIQVGAGIDNNFEFGNAPIYNFTVIKLDDENQPLAGAEFEMKNAQGEVVKTWTSGTAPTVLDDLDFGTYTIKETKVPDGYTASTKEWTVTIGRNSEKELTIVNTLIRYNITVEKFDTETNATLAGAKLVLKDAQGAVVYEWTSTDKVETIPNLKPGTYTLSEVSAPDGYEKNETIETVIVGANQKSNYRFGNTPLYSITVDKVDDDGNRLADAEFELRDSNDKLIHSWKSTGDKGETITNLKPGTYTIKETVIPDGYTVEDVTTTIVVSKNSKKDIVITNTLIRYDITVEKFDTETNATLAGAKLVLKDAQGEIIHEWISTDKAELISQLRPGVYTLSEITAPAGYQKNNTVETIVVGAGQQTNHRFGNTPIYSIIIKKLDDENQPLAGAKFELKDAQGNLVESWTSTTETKTIANLTPGSYVLTETVIPNGYSASQTKWDITVSKDSEKTIEIINTLIRYDIEVRKYDSETNDTLAGAKLVLKDASGEIVYEWTSTNKAETITGLKPGVYTLSEVSAPNGYRHNGSTLTITVGEGLENKFEFGNAPVYNFTVIKLDDEGKPLAGAEFKMVDKNGNVVKTWTSGTAPTAIDDLDFGTYTITETKVPDGYTASTKEWTVTIGRNGDKELTIVNTLIRYDITVEKLDDEDNRLAGAKFELKDAEGNLIHSWTSASDKVETIPQLKPGAYTITEIETPDGYTADSEVTNITVGAGFESNIVIRNTLIRYDITVEKYDTETDATLAGATLVLKDAEGNIVKEWISTDKAESIQNLKPGIYTLSEISAPNGYEKNETVMTITVGAGQESAYRFGNTPLYDIVIEKFDTKTDKTLAGAELILKDLNGNVIHNWISTDNAEEIKGLKPGIYKLTEIVAPEGYNKNETEMTIEVKKDGETTFRFGNTPEAIEELPESPQTGDNSNIGFYFFTMISSLLCLVILLFVRKRNNLNNN